MQRKNTRSTTTKKASRTEASRPKSVLKTPGITVPPPLQGGKGNGKNATNIRVVNVNTTKKRKRVNYRKPRHAWGKDFDRKWEALDREYGHSRHPKQRYPTNHKYESKQYRQWEAEHYPHPVEPRRLQIDQSAMKQAKITGLGNGPKMLGSESNITMLRAPGEHVMNANQPTHLDQERDALLLFETTRLNPGDRESPYVDEGKALPLTPLIGTLNTIFSTQFGVPEINYQVFLLCPTLGYARNHSGYAVFTRQNPTDTVDILPSTGSFSAFQSNVSAFGGNTAVFSDLFFAYAQRLDVIIGMPEATSSGYIYMGSRPLSAFKNSSGSTGQITIGDLIGTATVVEPAEHNRTYSLRGAVKNTKCINTVYAPSDSSSTQIGWNEIAEERVWYMIAFNPAASIVTQGYLPVIFNTCMKYNAVYNPDGKLTPLVEQNQKTAVVTENPTDAETLLSSNIATMMCDPEPQPVTTLNRIIQAVTNGALDTLENVISESIADLASEPMALAVAGALLMQHNAINYDHSRVETLWWTMNWIYPKFYTDTGSLPAELVDEHNNCMEYVLHYITRFRTFLDDNPVQKDGTIELQKKKVLDRSDANIMKPAVKMFR